MEGVAGSTTGSRGPEDAAEDYIRDIFMNGRVEKLPTSGRMLELPGEAKARNVDCRVGRYERS